eukprot:TRINITY_DN56078_c0_g1_i1.p1 TRINITY_DN56078_c0_g1~~TRINITY_DN56078_c0_g1_i1.p1  ORF type:complete len:469 (+),score=187.67 TRINITY_DN56078_c0_g1_i1:89-1408(+)
MLQPALPARPGSAERALEQIDKEIRQVEDALDDAEAKLADPQLRELVRGRVEVLQMQLRRLLVEQQRLQQQEERDNARRAMATRSPIPVPPEFLERPDISAEASMREVYGGETRTAFINRDDALRRRITHPRRPGDSSDYFDSGRPDALHTYSALQTKHGPDEKLEFFSGRADSVLSFSRQHLHRGDDTQVTYTVGYGRDGARVDDLPVELVQRQVVLRPGRTLDVLSDPPSALRQKVAYVEESYSLGPGATCRVARYRKDYTRGSVTAWLWPQQDWELRELQRQPALDVVSDADAAEIHTFVLSHTGQLDRWELGGARGSAQPSPDEMGDEYELLLRCEAATLRRVLALERERLRFCSVHLAGEADGELPTYRDSLPARAVAMSAQLDRLFELTDRLDHSAVAGDRKGATYDHMAATYERRIAELEQRVRDLERDAKP